MINFSRRSLARYAAQQLIDKQPTAKLARSLAAALIESKRQKEAELLLNDIAQELENRGLFAKATVTSASQLSAKLKQQLSSNVRKAAKVEQVEIVSEVDPAVIGGIRIETANHIWDKTIAHKLSEIKGGI